MATIAWPDLRIVLQGLRWAVVGGVATRAYMPERLARDFDILVHHQDGDAALVQLRQAGYQLASEPTISGRKLYAPDNTEIDLILIPFPWTDEALQLDKRDPGGYPILDLPYLVLMKMETSRAQDLADLSKMFGLAAEEDLERIKQIIARHMPAPADDLESLIYLGGMEMKRT